MTTLSEPTVGLLVQIAADARTRDQLNTLFLRADLEKDRYLTYDDFGGGGSSKLGLVRDHLLGALRAARVPGDDAHRSLLTFVRLLVEQTVRDPEDPPAWFADLVESLLGDGYQLVWDREEEMTDWGEPSRNVGVTYRILPTDNGPVPLAAEISALERDLGLRGYSDAVNHYRQAVNNFGQHQYEAANGQLRTMLEALVVRLAKDKVGYVGAGKAGEGGRAIKHIVSIGALPEGDGGRFLRGLWDMTHTNGSHPGQSTADECRMRMQVITATARFLLSRFPISK